MSLTRSLLSQPNGAPKSVENTIGKEKLHVTGNFPFPTQFSKDTEKQVSVLELTLQKTGHCFNSVPNNKILDQTKLKAFADDKCNKNDNCFFIE